ncbi:MAG: hypothetical protein RH946_12395 [Rhodospirillales bacterium]
MTPVTINKQMGITHAEFVRLLPRALKSHHFQVHDNTTVRVEGGHGKHIDIGLGPEQVRQIALMRIATTAVTLSFTGYSEAERKAFLEQFDRAYHRGGG